MFCFAIDDNRIKFLNGQAFSGLKHLKVVNLGGNQCIDFSFSDSIDIPLLPYVVSHQCGYTLSVPCNQDKIKNLEVLMNEKLHEIDICDREMMNKTAVILRLEAELNATKAFSDHQAVLIKELSEELDAQRNETCDCIDVRIDLENDEVSTLETSTEINFKT